MVNLFFSDSAGGSGALHKKAFGFEGEKLTSLDLLLYVGDISSPYNVSLRRDVYNAYFELDSEVSIDIRQLKKHLKKDKQLCLWYSAQDIDEYLGVLATIAQFEGKGISFFIGDCTEICESVAYLQFEENIPCVERRPLFHEEKESLLKEWQTIQAENAPLRLLRNGKVTGLPADYIDNELFGFIGEREVKIADLCQEFLQDELSRKLTFLLWRLRQLIKEGKIDVVKEDWDTDGFYGAPMKNFVRYVIKKNCDRLA